MPRKPKIDPALKKLTDVQLTRRYRTLGAFLNDARADRREALAEIDRRGQARKRKPKVA
jgi:hypothetical protein